MSDPNPARMAHMKSTLKDFGDFGRCALCGDGDGHDSPVPNTPKVELITPKVEANAAKGTQNGLLVPRSRSAVGAY